MNCRVYNYDKNKVQIAKAVIPFLIILHHCYFLKGLGFFHNLGIILVSFFFLMSGYGLMTSFMSKGKGYLKGFFSKRILKVFLPFLLSLVLWLGYEALVVDTFDIKSYFLDTNMGDWLPNSWFVWIILAGYVCFYIVFKLRISLRTKLILFSLISLLYYIMGGQFGLPQYWYRSSYAMVLGMLWRFQEINIRKLLGKKSVFCIFPVVCICCFTFFQKIDFKDVTPIFTCAAFAWLMYAFPMKKVNRVVNFLGKISYEVYLLQGIPIHFVCKYLSVNTTCYAIVLVFLLDILLAYMVHLASVGLHRCFVKE